MKWDEIKKTIVDDLSSRGLKDPQIRIRALEKIDKMLHNDLPEYIQNAELFTKTGKEGFKKQITKIKGRDLNGAEKSVINEIYYRVSPTTLHLSKPVQKYRMHICPYCFTYLKLTEDLWGSEALTCLTCGNDIPNPVKMEALEKKIIEGSLVVELFSYLTKIMLWLGGLILFIYLLVSC